MFQVCERSVTVSVTVEGRYLVAPCNDCACPPLPGTDAHGGDIAEGVGWDEEEAEGLLSRCLCRQEAIMGGRIRSAGYQHPLDTNSCWIPTAMARRWHGLWLTWNPGLKGLVDTYLEGRQKCVL